MPAIGTHIQYRPLRIGFCIRPNNLKALQEVSVINSYLVGGVLNPIIVINSEDTAEQIKTKVLQTNPDILYTEESSIKPQIKFFERDFFPTPFQIRDSLISEYKNTKDFQVLDINPVIRYIWDTYMKVSRKKYSNCILPEWDKNDKLAMLYSILFGQYSLDIKLKTNYKEAYVKGLKAKQFKIEKDSTLPEDLFNTVCPLTFTSNDLTPSYNNNSLGGFIIGKSDSFNDLVSFWNLRAMNMNAYFLPVDCIEKFEKCISIIKQRISILKSRSPNNTWSFDYLLYCSEDNESLVKDIKSKYFSDINLVHSTYKEDTLEAKQSLFYFDRQPIMMNVETKSDGRHEISCQLPDFKYDSDGYFPKKFYVASFHFLAEFEYPGSTLQFLDFTDLNEWYAREVCFEYDRFRVEPEGFGIIIDSRDFLTLRPINLNDYLKKILDRSKINAIFSEPGKIARQIIKQMDSIEGCRVFKITGVRNLLRRMDPLSERTRTQCCGIIADRKESTFSKFEDLYIEYRKEKALTKEMVFDYLVKKKVFRTGVTIKCSKCELKSWISLSNFSENIECPLCGNRFSPLIDNPSGVNWHFRRSGLFGRKNNQEGAIPVLLTLLQLIRAEHDLRVYPNHNLVLDNLICELDLIAFSSKKFNYFEGYDIIIGECKSPGRREEENSKVISKEMKSRYQILESDVEKMVKVKKALDSNGFKTHLLFSTTANKFSEDEIKIFKGLPKQYIYPILFTANELEPYWIYERYKDNVLPQQHAVALDHLAQNSVFIYLRDQDPQSFLK